MYNDECFVWTFKYDQIDIGGFVKDSEGKRKKRTTPSIVNVKLTGKQLIDAIVEHFYCYAANEFEKN